jgi:hypothetical protein
VVCISDEIKCDTIHLVDHLVFIKLLYRRTNAMTWELNGHVILLTATEAAALFGRYDMNSDEEISFYEFLDHFVGDHGKNSSYY